MYATFYLHQFIQVVRIVTDDAGKTYMTVKRDSYALVFHSDLGFFIFMMSFYGIVTVRQAKPKLSLLSLCRL